MKNVYTCILTTGTNPGSPFCPYEVKKKMQLAKYSGLLSINMLYQYMPCKQWKFVCKKGKK